MDNNGKNTLIENLVAAERYVTIAQQHIKRQQELILDLTAEGRDTRAARTLLSELEITRDMQELGRDQLRYELGLEMVPPA